MNELAKGPAKLTKAMKSWENRLDRHLADLGAYRKAGGYTSSVETEIRNFQGLIQAAKQVLGNIK